MCVLDFVIFVWLFGHLRVLYYLKGEDLCIKIMLVVFCSIQESVIYVLALFANILTTLEEPFNVMSLKR